MNRIGRTSCVAMAALVGIGQVQHKRTQSSSIYCGRMACRRAVRRMRLPPSRSRRSQGPTISPRR